MIIAPDQPPSPDPQPPQNLLQTFKRTNKDKFKSNSELPETLNLSAQTHLKKTLKKLEIVSEGHKFCEAKLMLIVSLTISILLVIRETSNLYETLENHLNSRDMIFKQYQKMGGKLKDLPSIENMFVKEKNRRFLYGYFLGKKDDKETKHRVYIESVEDQQDIDKMTGEIGELFKNQKARMKEILYNTVQQEKMILEKLSKNKLILIGIISLFPIIFKAVLKFMQEKLYVRLLQYLDLENEDTKQAGFQCQINKDLDEVKVLKHKNQQNPLTTLTQPQQTYKLLNPAPTDPELPHHPTQAEFNHPRHHQPNFSQPPQQTSYNPYTSHNLYQGSSAYPHDDRHAYSPNAYQKGHSRGYVSQFTLQPREMLRSVEIRQGGEKGRKRRGYGYGYKPVREVKEESESEESGEEESGEEEWTSEDDEVDSLQSMTSEDSGGTRLQVKSAQGYKKKMNYERMSERMTKK